MVEVIAFADVEAFAVSYLRSKIAGATVATRVPTTMPDQMVRVSRIGGAARDLITDASLVLVECWGTSTVSASELARQCRAHLLASARVTDSVTKAVDTSGVAFLPDPGTNSPRYQFTVELHLRGSTI